MGPKLQEFAETVYEITGLYYSCYSGFSQNHQALEKGQQYFINSLGNTIENMDKVPLSYGSGPFEAGVKPLYQTTQGQYKVDNKIDGQHHISIGNMAICQIYSYWEDFYRDQIALELGVTKPNLLYNIFGDLRHLRNSIVHHRAVALDNVTRCKLTTWFKEGDKISINKERFEFIIRKINAAIESMSKGVTMSNSNIE